MPCYTVNLDPLLAQMGIVVTKSARVRLDRFIQEILGTIDADCDTVWPLLNRRLQDPAWSEEFKRQLRAKWEAHDWREGLLS